MRKRLGLFIIGFVLALGTFLLYQYFTNATFLPPRVVRTNQDTILSPADRSHTYEFRKKSTGELKYIITAKSADPVKDKDGTPIPGQYRIVEPGATFYTKDGRTMNIRADICNLVLDQLPKAPKAAPSGGSSGEVDLPPFQVRVGTLSGNVMLTISAKPNVVGDPKPMDGELTVAFDDDVEIFQNQNLLTSSGKVHIRSDVLVYDGEALNLSYNRDEQIIEFLRIDKGDTVIIRNVGKQAFSLDSDEGEKSRTQLTRISDNKPMPATVALAGSGAGKAPVLPPVLPPVPAATAASQPKRQPYELTSYKMSFGNDVEASVGGRSLQSAQLFVLFQPDSQDFEKATTTPGPAVDAGPTATPPIPPPPAVIPPAPRAARATSRPALLTPAERHAAARRPYAPAGPDDLVIHWKGPMEMRPSGPDDLQLTGANDRALEAVGTRERPVVLKDELLTLTSGRLWYHGAADRIEIEPGDLPNVQITDASQGTLTCQGVSIVRGAGGGLNRGATGVVLKGPGTIEVPQSIVRESSRASREPTRISWTNKADIDFGTMDDPKKPGRKTQLVKRAVLRGDVAIRDDSYQLLADTLDVAIANVLAGPNKTSQALEHLLATGKVRVKFARGGGLGVDDASKPEGLNADALEVFTELRGGVNKAPAPSRILATGNVVAWTFSRDERNAEKKTGGASPPPALPRGAVALVDNQAKRLMQQTIYTPKLDIALEAKEKDKPSVVADSGSPAGLLLGSSNALKSMNASGGVKVEIEGFENTGKLIVATAETLTADKTGKAILEGAPGILMPNGQPKKVQIAQGENQISGDKVLLDQKSQSIEIPGEGMFSFLEQGRKGEPDTTVQINWTKSMTFDQISNTAKFAGLIETKQIGKADQISEMTCKESLVVVLYPSRGNPALGNEGGAGKLKSLLARGDVHAKGATHDPITRAVVTSIEVRVPQLSYSAENDTLETPGGSLVVEDYRLPKAGAPKREGLDGRGITAFRWNQGLAYIGQKAAQEAGTIRMLGKVQMRHVPTNAYEFVSAKSEKPANPKDIYLYGDELVAKLAQSKEAGGSKSVSSPVGLGSGGDVKFASAKAVGKALLEFGSDSISGESLEFDSAMNAAIARGKRGVEAQVVRPGQAIAVAEEIFWDLKKNTFKFTNPRGNFVR